MSNSDYHFYSYFLELSKNGMFCLNNYSSYALLNLSKCHSLHITIVRVLHCRSLRMSVIFYSALHLSFTKLLFHLHVLLFDHLHS